MENKQVKVLAIDDNHDNLISLKALIAESLPEVKTLLALSGTGGLELAKSENPDVILLDIIMPGMTGFEMLEKINKDKLSVDSVKIILSNKGQQSDIDMGKNLGAAGYIVKANSTPAEVMEKVQEILAQ